MVPPNGEKCTSMFVCKPAGDDERMPGRIKISTVIGHHGANSTYCFRYDSVIDMYKKSRNKLDSLSFEKLLKLVEAEERLTADLRKDAQALPVPEADHFDENDSKGNGSSLNSNNPRGGGKNSRRRKKKNNHRHCHSRIDFTAWDIPSLKKYKKVFGVSVRHGSNKAELASAIEHHFYETGTNFGDDKEILEGFLEELQDETYYD